MSASSDSTQSKKEWPCLACDCTFLTKNMYEQHCKSKTHKKVQAVAMEKQAAECTVYASNLQGLHNDKEAFLKSYFSKYGKIIKIKNGSRPDFAFVQFENQQSAKNAYQHKFHVHMGYRFLVREFIFKSLPQPNVQEKKKERENELQTLTKSLTAAQSLPHQFVMMCDLLVLSQQDIVIRSEICRNLTSMFFPYFEICSVHQFGSSINGYGMKGCDVDLFLDFNIAADCPGTGGRKVYKVPFEIPFHPKGVKGLPTRMAPLSPGQVDEMEDLDKVKFVCHILRSSRQPFVEMQIIPSKRCPLVRFVHRPTGLKCDLSLNNRKALYNSRLLGLYSQDPRVQQIVIIVRYWARVQQLSCSERPGNIFTSYALTWFVIYFLMQRKPRVIPLVNELLLIPEVKAQGVCEEIVDSCRCLFVPINAKLPPSQNQETTVDLLSGFFQFYASEVDWESQALSTYDGNVILKHSMEQNAFYADCKVGCMTILDPFILTHNIVANVTDTTRDRFVSEVKKAAEVIKSWLHPEFLPASGSNRSASWGLTDIFKPSPVEDKHQKPNKKEKGKIEGEQDNRTFLINLLPDLKLLSSEQFLKLSEKEGIAPGLLWCNLVRRLVLNVLESVYYIDVNEVLVEEECVGGGESQVGIDDSHSDQNNYCVDNDEEKVCLPPQVVDENDRKMEYDDDKAKVGDGEDEEDVQNKLDNDEVEDVKMDTLECVASSSDPLSQLSAQEKQMCHDTSEPEHDVKDTSKRLSQTFEENSSKRCKLHSESDGQSEMIETGSEKACDSLIPDKEDKHGAENNDTEPGKDGTWTETLKTVKSGCKIGERMAKEKLKSDSFSSSSNKKKDNSDPVKETLKKVVGDVNAISRVCSYSCLNKRSLWYFRVKVKQALASNKHLKGLELEREISRQVLVKLDQARQPSDSKSNKTKKKVSGNSDQHQSSSNSEKLAEKDKRVSDKFDQPGSSSDCTISEKERKVLDKLKQLRSCSSTEKEKGVFEKIDQLKSSSHIKSSEMVSINNISTDASLESQTTMNKTHLEKNMKTTTSANDKQENPKVENPELNSEISFNSTIVECRYVASSHPRVLVIMHPKQEQLNHFRNFFASATVLITKLVSCHLLDNEL